ncbi:MAG: zf-HC2 domain-containing protein [Candidatus Omnitrophota bacterium]
MKLKNSHLENLIRVVYRHWKKNLPQRKRRCPDEETLACFVEGLLSRKERNRIIKHLLGCDRCLEYLVMSIRLSLGRL